MGKRDNPAVVRYQPRLTTDNTINASKAAFATRFSSLIWFITTGLQLFVVWWYRKSAVFWLPEGWVPGFIAWLLRWPSAPKGEWQANKHPRKLTTGAVSSAAWATVCKRVLQSAEEVYTALKEPVPAAPTPVPVAMPSDEKARPSSRAPTGAKIEELPEVTVEELD